MLSLRYSLALATALLWLPLADAQLNVPKCVSQCIDQSTDDSCPITDLKCICRESNGRFLPDLVICMKGNCDPSLDVSALLQPLELGCSLLGVPLSPGAISNAEGLASSLALQTTTMTVASPSLTTVTVTSTAGGSTLIIAYSGTVGSNSIVSLGQPSTVTEFGPGSTTTVVGAGSTNGQTGSIQVVTTTNSAGSTFTTTQILSSAIAGTGNSASASSTTTIQTTVAAQATTADTTSNPSGSKTSSARPPDDTNGSPFTYPSAAGRRDVGSWLGLSMFLIVVIVWA